MSIKRLSNRAFNQIRHEYGHVINSLATLGRSLRDEGITNVSGNYLIANVIADTGGPDQRVQTVAEAAAYIMAEKNLELLGFSMEHRGGLILGKNNVPMMVVGTTYWGDNNPRESLMLLSDLINRSRGTYKNMIVGDSITSILKRVDPDVFNPAKYTFHEDEFVRVLVDGQISRSSFRKMANIDYMLDGVTAKKLFDLMDVSTTSIIDAGSEELINSWFSKIRQKRDSNEENNYTSAEIKKNMALGSVCVISMKFHPQNYSAYADTNFFGFPGHRYCVLVIRADEFGVRKVVSRRYIDDVSEIEKDYPHITSAFHLRRIETGHPFRFEGGYSEAYGCTGFHLYSVGGSKEDRLFKTPAVVFPEKMHIEKAVLESVPAPVSADAASAIPALDF